MNIPSDGASIDDRRDHARVAVRQTLTYDYYDQAGQKLGVGIGTTINVSEDGLMMTTDKYLQPDMQVLVEIVSHLYVFMATAVVAHSAEVGDTLYQIGVRYADIIQGDWGLIDASRPSGTLPDRSANHGT